jgi:hypothetical protein
LVRRLLASLLVLLFSVPLIVPLVLSGQTEMPVCCRRSGKHHCGMAGEKNYSGTSISPSRDKCPFSLNSGSLAALEKFVIPMGQGLSFALVQRRFDGLRHIPAAPATGGSGPVSLRGPPSFYL